MLAFKPSARDREIREYVQCAKVIIGCLLTVVSLWYLLSMIIIILG
jgi:hypothetical protein